MSASKAGVVGAMPMQVVCHLKIFAPDNRFANVRIIVMRLKIQKQSELFFNKRFLSDIFTDVHKCPMNISITTNTQPRTCILSAGVLYLCLLGLINTIFFPTVQESLSRHSEVKVHSDSSLLEVIMEAFFDVSDTDTDPH